MNGRIHGSVVNIYQDGTCIYSIDLSAVTDSYTIQIDGAVSNTVAVEHGKICVQHATCPDQICVRQGWISNSIVPVVCLPNNLVIQIETTDAAAAGIDAMSR